MGKKQIVTLIQHFDAKLEHEDFGKISEIIKRDNVEIFDFKEEQSHGTQNEPLVIRTFLDCNKPLRRYFDCQLCKKKDILIKKGLSKSQSGKTILKDEDDVKMALEFGDFHHVGFQKAYNRLRSWCTFDDMEEKVSEQCLFI